MLRAAGVRRARGRQHRRRRSIGARRRARPTATVFVLEVSSFQLEGIDRFRPHVAVFLNLSPDHLDRHPSFEAYAAGQGAHLREPDAADCAVVNADDPEVLALGAPRALAAAAGPRRGSRSHGRRRLLRRGLRAGCASRAASEVLFARADVRAARGRTSPATCWLAAAAARLPGRVAGRDRARGRAPSAGVEHVLEHVATIGGVAFYNDSKATNVEAAARASLEAFTPARARDPGRPLQGRRLRASSARRSAARARARAGHRRGARTRSRRALGGVVPVERCAIAARGGRPGARSRARARATSCCSRPACSSFDMFRDYAERGRAFKAEVAAQRRGAEERTRG